MSYALVNAPFLLVAAAAALVAALVARRRGVLGRSAAGVGITLVGLLVLTAVFDNVIIALGIVDYDASRTSGATVGLAPVEDFAYAIAAAVGLPALWLLLPARPRKEQP